MERPCPGIVDMILSRRRTGCWESWEDYIFLLLGELKSWSRLPSTAGMLETREQLRNHERPYGFHQGNGLPKRSWNIFCVGLCITEVVSGWNLGLGCIKGW